jgi:hypothetical protein
MRASDVSHPHDRLARRGHPRSPIKQGRSLIRHGLAFIVRADPLAPDKSDAPLPDQISNDRFSDREPPADGLVGVAGIRRPPNLVDPLGRRPLLSRLILELLDRSSKV